MTDPFGQGYVTKWVPISRELVDTEEKREAVCDAVERALAEAMVGWQARHDAMVEHLFLHGSGAPIQKHGEVA